MKHCLQEWAHEEDDASARAGSKFVLCYYRTSRASLALAGQHTLLACDFMSILSTHVTVHDHIALPAYTCICAREAVSLSPLSRKYMQTRVGRGACCQRQLECGLSKVACHPQLACLISSVGTGVHQQHEAPAGDVQDLR